MREEERLEVLKRIKKDIEDQAKRDEIERKLYELEIDPRIIEYKALQIELALYREKLYFKKDKEEAENTEFVWAFTSRTKGELFEPCDHPFYLYEGSYGKDWIGENEQIYSLKDENEKDFYQNVYVCLECGKTVSTAEWQEFEKNNVVLIGNKKPSFYRDYYYRLLLKNTVKTSKQQILKKLRRK